MRTSLLLLISLCLAGCATAPAELEVRVIELELRFARLEGRLDALASHDERLAGLEAAITLPDADERLLAHVATLEARLVELESRGAQGPQAEPESAPANVIVGPGPPNLERKAPPAGVPVKVMATGSGSLVLIESEGTMVRVELLGVVPPQRADDYEAHPGLRLQYEEALGAARVATDEPWESSERFLHELLKDATVTLEYPPGGAGRGPSGAVAAYVVAERGLDRVDVNAEVLRAGYALAGPRHGRYREFFALEQEARAAKRGLFE